MNKQSQNCSTHYDFGGICQLCGPYDRFDIKEAQLMWILLGKLKEKWQFETKRDVTWEQELLIKNLTAST
jgi:hypothetical protein